MPRRFFMRYARSSPRASAHTLLILGSLRAEQSPDNKRCTSKNGATRLVAPLKFSFWCKAGSVPIIPERTWPAFPVSV